MYSFDDRVFEERKKYLGIGILECSRRFSVMEAGAVELGVSVTGAIGARGRIRTLVYVSRLYFEDDQTYKDPG